MTTQFDPIKQYELSRLLSPAEVAEFTGLHVEVIRRAVRRGELPGFSICRRIRVHTSDLKAWLERSRVSVALEDGFDYWELAA